MCANIKPALASRPPVMIAWLVLVLVLAVSPPSLCVPASVYMPSFTSGFLPLDLPRHLRGKLNKEREKDFF